MQVLIAEDDRMYCFALATSLQKCGHNVGDDG